MRVWRNGRRPGLKIPCPRGVRVRVPPLAPKYRYDAIIREIYMSQNGKGSKPRPFSVSNEDFAKSWDNIFSKQEDNTGVDKNEYQDILSTEECFDTDNVVRGYN